MEQNLRIKQSRIPNVELFVKSNRDFILPGPDNSFLYNLIALSYKSGLRKTEYGRNVSPGRFSGESEGADGLKQHAHTENMYTSQQFYPIVNICATQ